MARISVFGIGYVGAVAAACLARDGHYVVAVDIDEAKVDLLNRGQAPVVEDGLSEVLRNCVDEGRIFATSDIAFAMSQTDVSFVCVGTPSDSEGALDLSYVQAVCQAIGAELRDKKDLHSVIMRSTILPGTCEDVCVPLLERTSGKRAGKGFGFGYYPEFLREGSALEDYDDPGLVVFAALDEATRNFLHMVNATQDCCLHDVSLRTAEMIKYTSNSWRATKITFANEIGNIAKSCGLDGQEVMDVLCSDYKISMSPKFLRPGFAFGGSCLPKDIRALRHLASRANTPTPLLGAVLDANEAQIARAERMVADSGAQTIGFIGISFKPGTDDLRESPLAELAGRLAQSGKSVCVYDPFVSQGLTAKKLAWPNGHGALDLSGSMVSNLSDLIQSSDALVVGNFYQETVEALGAAAITKPTIDLTRLRRDMTSSGSYSGICW